MAVANTPPINLDQIMNFQDFSNLNRLLRVTAEMLRFAEIGRGRSLRVLSVQYSGHLLEAVE